MQAIVFMIRHEIDEGFDRLHREKVTANVDQQPAPGFLRRVFYLAERKQSLVLRAKLRNRRRGVYRSGSTPCFHQHTCFIRCDAILLRCKRIMITKRDRRS